MSAAVRPELGEIRVGDLVYVERSPNDMRNRSESERYIPARITKASRVWIEMEAGWTPPPNDWSFSETWRMRRDTRNEGTQYPGSNASFVTPAQRDYDAAHREARAYLIAQGVVPQRGSRWSDRETELAALLRAANGETTVGE